MQMIENSLPSSGRQLVLPQDGLVSWLSGRRVLAIASLPFTWWQRSSFRKALRADLRDRPEQLRDMGIRLHEAQAETVRFFWEPIILSPR